jgi:hypothetical protein
MERSVWMSEWTVAVLERVGAEGLGVLGEWRVWIKWVVEEKTRSLCFRLSTPGTLYIRFPMFFSVQGADALAVLANRT